MLALRRLLASSTISSEGQKRRCFVHPSKRLDHVCSVQASSGAAGLAESFWVSPHHRSYTSNFYLHSVANRSKHVLTVSGSFILELKRHGTSLKDRGRGGTTSFQKNVNKILSA